MGADTWCEVVRELADMLAADPGLRRQVEDALRDRDAQPGDAWREVTLEGFFRFFDDWHTCMPVIENEQTFLNDLITFHRTPKAMALVRETPVAQWLNRFAKARGEFLDSAASVHMVTHWSRHPAIDMTDFIVPEKGFSSFNEFFTRRVRPGARPIAAADDESVLVSPADSEIQPPLALDPRAPVAVKGEHLSLDDLLQRDPCAAEFRDGIAMVHFLGVRDYHRFHAPVAGRIVRETMIGGLCFGCDEYPGQFFTEHHRGLFVFETRFGRVGMVTVGIATVSSIRHLRAAGDVVRKGDELGFFAYGGSAILLLFPPGQVSLDPRAEKEHLLMGTRIGCFARSPRHDVSP